MGDTREVYWNLHRDVFSVRGTKTGRVVSHNDHILLRNAKFVVRPSGRARVLKEGRKNVHAFVRGEECSQSADYIDFSKRDKMSRVATYNPYKYDSFVDKKSEESLDKLYDVLLCKDNNGKPKIFYKEV